MSGSDIHNFDDSKAKPLRAALDFRSEYMGAKNTKIFIISQFGDYQPETKEGVNIFYSIKKTFAWYLSYNKAQTFRVIDKTPDKIKVNDKEIKSGFCYVYLTKKQIQTQSHYTKEWFEDKGFVSFEPSQAIINDHCKKINPNTKVEDIVFYKLEANRVAKAEDFKDLVDQIGFSLSEKGADSLDITFCFKNRWYGSLGTIGVNIFCGPLSAKNDESYFGALKKSVLGTLSSN